MNNKKYGDKKMSEKITDILPKEKVDEILCDGLALLGKGGVNMNLPTLAENIKDFFDCVSDSMDEGDFK